MALIDPTGDALGTAYEQMDIHNLPKDGDYDDEDALRLCVQDAETAEAWNDSHWINYRYLEASFAYQCPPKPRFWEGTSIPKADIPRFTVATHVNSIAAKVKQGLFYEEPPFELQAQPKTSEDAIRAITTVMDVQLDSIHARREFANALFDALLFGTCIMKWGWKTYTKKEKKYKRRGEPLKLNVMGKETKIPTKRSQSFEVIETEKTISEPYIEQRDIRYVLVDPKCRKHDIRTAKYVIDKFEMSYRDLVKLKEESEAYGGTEYNLPSEEEIRSWFEPPLANSVDGEGDPATASMEGSALWHHAAPRFQKTTEDPLDTPLEVLERWTDDRVITVIQRCKVIRNSVNEFGVKPYLSAVFMPLPDAFWGFGLGAIIGGIQRTQKGITDASLDIVSMVLQPNVLRNKNAISGNQSIRQRLGGIIDVDGDPKAAMMYQPVPTIPAEVFLQLQQLSAEAEASSGANELTTMGNLPEKGRTSITRTATGASTLASAAMSRIGDFVTEFVDQVFEPFLRHLHEMNCERLPLADLQEILNEQLGEAFTQSFDETDYLNASIKKFKVLAGSNLAVRQQMAQAIVLMTQLFESPQTLSELAKINGKYVDIEELLHLISDLSGFGLGAYYSIVKDLTPAMKQQMAAEAQAQAQAPLQGKMALQQQKQQGAMDLLNQKSINRGVELGLRTSIEKAVQSEAETGEPGDRGLGSTQVME